MWYAYLNASTCVACSVCGRLKTTFHDNDFLSPQVAKMGLRETGLHGKCFYCKTTLLIFLTSKHWKWSHHALAKAWTCRAVTDNETARQQRAHPTYTAAQVDPKAKVPRDTRDWKWLNNTWFHLQTGKKQNYGNREPFGYGRTEGQSVKRRGAGSVTGVSCPRSGGCKPTELYTRKINSWVLCNISGCHLKSPVSEAGPVSVCEDGLVPWEGCGSRHRRLLRQGLGCWAQP